MTTPTNEQLQVMYNNFVKISQWLTRKDQAPSPLPPLYADILAELKALRDKVEDLEFKQAANLEEIHYLQGLIERKSAEQGEAITEPEQQATPKPAKKQTMAKPSRKKKNEVRKEENPVGQSPLPEELPSAPSLIPAPAHLKEQEVSASATQGEDLPEQATPEPSPANEPLDIELDSTVFTSVSEEVSRLLDEINKKEDEDDTD